ncbi:MAG: DUF488 family protein [Candidatus Pacebacteria bacterium]|nr:DUF488 family protein [Candidatus Paceibacterota bacterium]
MLKIKRIYDPRDKNDGFRVLVDRLWPRGVSKEKAKIDLWLKDIAPSGVLRKWFGHKEERWKEFKKRYLKELKEKKELVEQLKAMDKNGVVTLLYAAKDEVRNNAVVIKKLLNT